MSKTKKESIISNSVYTGFIHAVIKNILTDTNQYVHKQTTFYEIE